MDADRLVAGTYETCGEVSLEGRDLRTFQLPSPCSRSCDRGRRRNLNSRHSFLSCMTGQNIVLVPHWYASTSSSASGPQTTASRRAAEAWRHQVDAVPAPGGHAATPSAATFSKHRPRHSSQTSRLTMTDTDVKTRTISLGDLRTEFHGIRAQGRIKVAVSEFGESRNSE